MKKKGDWVLVPRNKGSRKTLKTESRVQGTLKHEEVFPKRKRRRPVDPRDGWTLSKFKNQLWTPNSLECATHIKPGVWTSLPVKNQSLRIPSEKKGWRGQGLSFNSYKETISKDKGKYDYHFWKLQGRFTSTGLSEQENLSDILNIGQRTRDT